LRSEDSGSSPQVLDRERFVDRLLGYRALFGQPPKVQLSLMTLTPVERGKLEGRWQGTCLLRMWGETQPAQPPEVALYLGYQVARPTRESLVAGEWLSGCAITQSQVAHASRRLMREVAAERGIDITGLHDNWKLGPGQTRASGGGVFLCDYDRDGIMDMLI